MVVKMMLIATTTDLVFLPMLVKVALVILDSEEVVFVIFALILVLSLL